MYGTCRWTQLREFYPKLEPCEVPNIKNQKESEEDKRQRAEGQVLGNWQGSWHSRGDLKRLCLRSEGNSIGVGEWESAEKRRMTQEEGEEKGAMLREKDLQEQ